MSLLNRSKFSAIPEIAKDSLKEYLKTISNYEFEYLGA